MPFLMSFVLEHEIITFAWIANAFVQFPLNFYTTKGLTGDRPWCGVFSFLSLLPGFGQAPLCRGEIRITPENLR